MTGNLGGQSNSSDMCSRGHVFVWSGDPTYKIPEGYPCACGQTKYKSVSDFVGIAKRDIKRDEVLTIVYNPDGSISSDAIYFSLRSDKV